MSLPRVRAALVLLLAAAAARAETLKVPSAFATVQAAVDAAGVGDVIVIASGTYLENVEVADKAGLEIRGSGKVLLDGGLTDPALSLSGCQDVRLVNLRLVNGAVSCLSLLESGEIEVEKCRTLNGAQDGISIITCNVVTLKQCRVEESERHGILVSDSDDVVLDRCRVLATGDDGLHAEAFDHLDALLAVKCKFLETLGDGIEILSGKTVTITDCLVQDCGAVGIRSNFIVNPTDVHVSVVDCRVLRTGLDSPAISLTGSFQTVEGTVVRDAHDGIVGSAGFDGASHCDLRDIELTAITASNSTVADIADNRIRKASDGILLSGVEAEVHGNDIRLVSGRAILADSGTLESGISHNTIRSAGTGIFMFTSTDCTISENVISKSTFGIGTLSIADAHTILGNLVSKCGTGLSLDGNGAEVADNLVLAPSGDGYVIGGDDNVVTGNTCKKAGELGFSLVAGSAGNVLSLNVASGSGEFDLQDQGTNTIEPDNEFGTVAP